MRTRTLLCILALATAVLSMQSCFRGSEMAKIELPLTPVDSVRSSWAVVVSPYLRVRREAQVAAEVVAHLRNAAMLEIVSRSTYPELVEGETDYWYQVSTEGKRGWVFGSYIELFDTRGAAEARIKAMLGTAPAP